MVRPACVGVEKRTQGWGHHPPHCCCYHCMTRWTAWEMERNNTTGQILWYYIITNGYKFTVSLSGQVNDVPNIRMICCCKCMRITSFWNNVLNLTNLDLFHKLRQTVVVWEGFSQINGILQSTRMASPQRASCIGIKIQNSECTPQKVKICLTLYLQPPTR